MTQANWAAEETFKEHKGLIHSTVKEFAKQKGVCGDGFEDMTSQAMLYYTQAYVSHDPEVANFSTHARFKIWMGLLEQARKIAKEKARMQRVGLETLPLTHKEGFSPEKFFSDLSPDAQFLGQLVLDPPSGLAQRGVDKVPSIRASLKKFLKDLGWSMERITETFQEIREALA